MSAGLRLFAIPSFWHEHMLCGKVIKKGNNVNKFYDLVLAVFTAALSLVAFS